MRENRKMRGTGTMEKRFLKRKRNSRVLAFIFLFVLLCSGATGCGSDDSADSAYMAKSSDYDYYDADAEYVTEAETGDYGLDDSVEAKSAQDVATAENATASAASGTDSTALVSNSQKIIKKYYYNYETETFDEAHSYLKEQIEKYNGYISSSEVSGTLYRTLQLTARIPADVSDEFVGQLGSLGTVTSQSESADDITLQYTDTESRIASLKTEQERLNALLEKADSLETIIALEERLTEVRYELENYQSQKKLYDDLISYCTVNIFLEEVNYTVEVDDTSVISRISTGLKTSFRDIKDACIDFIVWLIVALPYLIIWAVVIFIIVKVVRGIRRRIKAKKAKKEELKNAKKEELKNADEPLKEEEK